MARFRALRPVLVGVAAAAVEALKRDLSSGARHDHICRAAQSNDVNLAQ